MPIRGDDNRVRLFRPELNMERMNVSVTFTFYSVQVSSLSCGINSIGDLVNHATDKTMTNTNMFFDLALETFDQSDEAT